MRTHAIWRIVVMAALIAVVAGPSNAWAAATPLVRLTLSATPNPAAASAPLTYTITVTPVNGTIASVEVFLSRGVFSCTPEPNCVLASNGTPTWIFTNVSGPVTGTAESQGASGGEDVYLYLNAGAGCTGACPARVHLVVPVASLQVSYTGPSPVVSGSVLHFSVTGNVNAWPMDTTLQVTFPTGLDDPTGADPGTAIWDAGGRRLESYQVMDKSTTLTFDAAVSATNGTTITVVARTFPNPSNVRANSRTLSIAVGSQIPPSPTIERIYGSDRYATGAAITHATFGGDTFAAFIATGTNYPDALVAGPAAFLRGGPVLLVTKDSIPASVKAELARTTPSTIFILGGTATISSAVQAQLGAYSYNPVQRLDGTDRYDTGSKVVSRVFGGYTGPVFIATGANFPDALSGGPAAAQFTAPILLSGRDGLPFKSLELLGTTTPTKFFLLGGPSVLSSMLVTQLAKNFPGVPVERWSGSDRYATSAAISAHAFPAGATTVFLAIGTNYPDALSGGPAAADAPGPILLTQSTCMPAPIYAELQRLNPTRIVLLGGPTVLADSAATTMCSS